MFALTQGKTLSEMNWIGSKSRYMKKYSNFKKISLDVKNFNGIGVFLNCPPRLTV